MGQKKCTVFLSLTTDKPESPQRVMWRSLQNGRIPGSHPCEMEVPDLMWGLIYVFEPLHPSFDARRSRPTSFSTARKSIRAIANIKQLGRPLPVEGICEDVICVLRPFPIEHHTLKTFKVPINDNGVAYRREKLQQ